MICQYCHEIREVQKRIFDPTKVVTFQSTPDLDQQVRQGNMEPWLREWRSHCDKIDATKTKYRQEIRCLQNQCYCRQAPSMEQVKLRLQIFRENGIRLNPDFENPQEFFWRGTRYYLSTEEFSDLFL